MALGSKVVDFIRADLLKKTRYVARIGKVAIMENQPLVLLMWILEEMADAMSIECGSASDKTVHFISFVEEEFS
jgi:hypothetical protein